MIPRSALWVAFALASSGCAVVTPPPMLMLHEPVTRSAPRGGSVAVVGGFAGGVFQDNSAGGLGVASVQVTPAWRVEASGGVGARLFHHGEGSENVPSVLGFGRVGARHRAPGRDWLSLGAGVGGGGASTGLAYGTLDVGVSVGRTFGGWFRPYTGLSLALSVPLQSGAFVLEDRNDPTTRTAFGTTFWIGGNAGASMRVAERLELGVEGTLFGGMSAVGENAFAGAVTASLRYAFGPTR